MAGESETRFATQFEAYCKVGKEDKIAGRQYLERLGVGLLVEAA